MILRYWRGWTTPENANAYGEIVSTQVLPSIAARGIAGYHGAYLLRRPRAEDVEFATILLFDSIDAVRALAGENYEAAYVPQHARAVLFDFDTTSAHYEVISAPPPAGERCY